MKLNQDKCHLLVSGHKHESVWVKIGGTKIWESQKQKLLGLIINRNLNFDDYVFSLCKEAGKKISALSRVSSYISFEKRRILLKAFVESQFGYCPLTWMFHSRQANNKINHIHERALRLIYRDNNATFEDLLKKDNSFKVHYRNIQSLAIELFKVKNNISNKIMNDIFETKNTNYNLRNKSNFSLRSVKTEKFGIDSLQYLANKVWNMVPTDIKALSSLELFKEKIRKWEPKECHCKLCKNYVHNIGYVNVL